MATDIRDLVGKRVTITIVVDDGTTFEYTGAVEAYGLHVLTHPIPTAPEQGDAPPDPPFTPKAYLEFKLTDAALSTPDSIPIRFDDTAVGMLVRDREH
jgi:hypothetical protein